jgi:D-cysteine desulfhydrase
LREQTAALGIEPDLIVFPSSSGGTQAGLVAGAWALGWDVPILGVSIDATAEELQGMVADLASQTAGRLSKPHTFAPADIRVSADYLGAGYGVVGDLERQAISLMARTEGILLDPVYTGRAFGGLMDILKRPDRFEKPFDKLRASSVRSVVFWHTGGSPALFAYADQLTGPGK